MKVTPAATAAQEWMEFSLENLTPNSADLVLRWEKLSISVHRRGRHLNLLARWQMKAGKKTEAITAARDAIAAGKASKDKVDTAATAATEKLLAEWSAK